QATAADRGSIPLPGGRFPSRWRGDGEFFALDPDLPALSLAMKGDHHTAGAELWGCAAELIREPGWTLGPAVHVGEGSLDEFPEEHQQLAGQTCPLSPVGDQREHGASDGGVFNRRHAGHVPIVQIGPEEGPRRLAYSASDGLAPAGEVGHAGP